MGPSSKSVAPSQSTNPLTQLCHAFQDGSNVWGRRWAQLQQGFQEHSGNVLRHAALHLQRCQSLSSARREHLLLSFAEPRGGRLSALGSLTFTSLERKSRGQRSSPEMHVQAYDDNHDTNSSSCVLHTRKKQKVAQQGPGAKLREVFSNLGGAASSRRRDHAEKDDRVLISEARPRLSPLESQFEASRDLNKILVEVRGVDGELKAIAESCIAIRPNFSYSLQEVKEDANRVFQSGFFEKLDPSTEDTRDGVKLIFNVTANRPLKGVVVQGANCLPQRLIEDAFRDQYGSTLNFARFGQSLEDLNNWYEDRDIVGQVSHVGMNENTAEIQISEMTINSINLRFEDRKSGEVKDEGKTKPEVILRQVLSQPGHVYSKKQAKEDIEAVYSMGLFHDVNITPQVCEDSTALNPKVDLNLNLVERKTGGISGGGGISATGHSEGNLPGIIGSAAYSQRNLFGLNQKLNASVEIGQLDKVFRINHTDPWVRGDPHRTSRTISLQNMRTSGNQVHGRAPDDVARGSNSKAEDPAGDGNIIIARTTGGVEYGRPLATGWTGTAGLNWQRSKCIDDHGSALTEDAYRSPLTFSGGKSDSMMVALLRAVFTGPQETQLVGCVEQAVPVVASWLNFNRAHGRAERTFPVLKSPLKLRLCGKGGCILGDMPPYEAFPLGGTNSVRGYAEGAVGSARTFTTGNVELRWPLFGPLEGTVFADYGTDFDSGQTILGDPAGVRGKPGSGYGYGAGVRLDSSLGAIRFEFAFNDQGARRFHLGIGNYG